MSKDYSQVEGKEIDGQLYVKWEDYDLLICELASLQHELDKLKTK